MWRPVARIKSVIRVYEDCGPARFRFFGNVEVGADVTVDELRERYHAVVFAYGTSVDRQPGSRGRNLQGSHSATGSSTSTTPTPTSPTGSSTSRASGWS